MGKAARRKAHTTTTATRIVLTPRECQELQGLSAVAALTLLQLRQQLADQMAAAQRPPQDFMARLAVKYAKQGMRADALYTLDVATHTLVEEGFGNGHDETHRASHVSS